MTKVDYNKIFTTLRNILIKYGFSKDDAETCSEIFSENTLVGVASHGINRFKSFLKLIESGHINPSSKPIKIKSFGAIEQWDGLYGPGPLIAKLMSNEAIRIADEYGIGCIALKNSNHWMRPGYYAWEAASKGYIFICWTNTIPIMPPWGGKSPTTGNNPIVFGVPRKDGNIVLDMALSQYSYGKLSTYAREGKDLPFDGGYDKNGNLTKNAKEIYDTYRTLPIGLWKGAGLSLMLDLIATILSEGKSTSELGKDTVDSGMSQIYIAIDPNKFSGAENILDITNEVLKFYTSSEKITDDDISFPGERIFQTRENNLKNGIPVDENIWSEILKLGGVIEEN